MREIKFRGKDIENDNLWRYGSLITYPSGCTSIIEFDKFGNELNHDVDPDTVGQFTGLKDKNGKEIYEGDVIRSPLSEDKTRPHRIFYHTGNAAFMGALVDRKELCYLRLDQDWIYKFGKEVIGNIHDNPELIK